MDMQVLNVINDRIAELDAELGKLREVRAILHPKTSSAVKTAQAEINGILSKISSAHKLVTTPAKAKRGRKAGSKMSDLTRAKMRIGAAKRRKKEPLAEDLALVEAQAQAAE
jgi:hypothetical protein